MNGVDLYQFLSSEATNDLLVGVQEADPDCFYDDLCVHGEDVNIFLCYPQFALHQVPRDLERKKMPFSGHSITSLPLSFHLF